MDPRTTIDELRELHALTSTDEGAQRVAFTPIWMEAREWLRRKLSELPVEVHQDEAGNLWATLQGERDEALIVGGHLDSVPNGGWLDGVLGTLTALSILRDFASGPVPRMTIRLVDWADEEGARFGKSLFGSSACSGNLDLSEAAQLVDADGVSLRDALDACGIRFSDLLESRTELAHAAAYIELHIEQGPVLLEVGLPLGVVEGTFGVERHAITFRGQAAHSGSTPMHCRRDAFLAASRMASEIYSIAARSGIGVCTIGSCQTKPGIPTSVVEECTITLDQRHLDSSKLEEMLCEAQQAATEFSQQSGTSVDWRRLLRIAPVGFDPRLSDLCEESISETGVSPMRLPSGPLHDAAEMARAGIPTAMMFVQSLKGISHTRIEDTREDHLELAICAMHSLARKIAGLLG